MGEAITDITQPKFGQFSALVRSLQLLSNVIMFLFYRDLEPYNAGQHE